MRILAGLILIALLAVGAWYFLGNQENRNQVQQVGESVSESATRATEAVRDKLHDLNLNTEDLKEELAKSGKVVREKAREISAKVADATSDARVTAAIKAKLVKDSSLSALDISVNTTDGVVTLSGHVKSHDDIKKAMDLALATDGCEKAISTLQVKE